jgi:aarF domain-containing kinase
VQSPALIKAGQALASRSDLLPKEYLDTLQSLQDRCPPFATADAEKLFEEELGCKFNDVFELESYEPVAAASIGQVYKGRLRSNGRATHSLTYLLTHSLTHLLTHSLTYLLT